jgi:UDP-glucuronate decarboxylase
MLEIAQRTKAITGSTSRIEFLPLPVDDPCRRQPDISLATRLFGWTPHTSLEQGLRKTADYFASVIGSARTATAETPM